MNDNTKIQTHMALVRELIALASYHGHGAAVVWHNFRNVEASAAALATPPSAATPPEPSDAKDAARYRQLVAMKDKAAPETIAHYVRNPAHLDRVIEVMEHQP